MISLNPLMVYWFLIDYKWKGPSFQFPDDMINELNRTLSILYPHLYLDLEQTFHNLPTEIESERTLHELINLYINIRKNYLQFE